MKTFIVKRARQYIEKVVVCAKDEDNAVELALEDIFHGDTEDSFGIEDVIDSEPDEILGFVDVEECD